MRAPYISHGGEQPVAAAFDPHDRDQLAAELAGIFKLLADETRLKVLLTLVEQEEMHVRGLCERLGQSQPAVSHHLALLLAAGMIERRRDGKHNFYRRVPHELGQLLDSMLNNSPDKPSEAG